MKRTWLFVIAGMLITLALLGQGPAAQAAQCSQSGAAGKYGFTLNGVVITPNGPVPIAAVGKAMLDASGNVSGAEARSVGGGFADDSFTGTYTVNAACT